MRAKTLKAVILLSVMILMVWGASAQDATSSPTPSTPTDSTPTTATPAATSTPDPESTASGEEISCPTLVQQALDLTEQNCGNIGQNEVCYGHSILEAAARAGQADFNFNEPGDIEDVIEMQSLSLSAMDTVREIWGVILMNVQAGFNLIDESNVTFVVFGDTDIQSSYDVLEIESTINANIRELPSANAPLLTVVEAGLPLLANGRTEDSAWLRVVVDDDRLGWVSSEIVTTQANIEPLAVIELDDELNPLAYFGPMQAFFFESGEDDAPCEAAPNSGLMIQTPEGSATVTLWIDEVIIELNGTAFVQAQANGDLTVNTLEGTADITALGETRTAISGTRVKVSLDEDLTADEVPQDAEPFDEADVTSLPTDLLPREVEVSTPREVIAGAPAEGNWRFAWGVDTLECPDGTVIPFETSGGLTAITVSDGGETVNRGGPYTRQSEGIYTRTYVDGNGNLYQDTLTISSSTRIDGVSVIDFAATVCTLNVPFSLDFVN